MNKLIKKELPFILLLIAYVIVYINNIEINQYVRYAVTLLVFIYVLINRNYMIPFFIFIGIVQPTVSFFLDFPFIDIYIFSLLILLTLIYDYKRIIILIKSDGLQTQILLVILFSLVLTIFFHPLNALQFGIYSLSLLIVVYGGNYNFDKHVINSFIYVGMMISIVILLKYVDFSSQYNYYQVLKELRDRNHISTLLGFGVVIAAYFVITRNNMLFNICILLIFLTCIILIASRGGVLTTFLALFFIFFQYNRKIAKFLTIGLSSFLLIIVLIQFGVFDMLLYRTEDVSNISTAGGRTFIWVASTLNFADASLINMLSGVGYMGSEFDYTGNVTLMDGSHGISIHNNFLAILLDFGLLGFIIYGYLFLSIFFRVGKLQKGLFIVLLLGSVTLTTYNSSTYWIILGYIISPIVYQKYEIQSRIIE